LIQRFDQLHDPVPLDTGKLSVPLEHFSVPSFLLPLLPFLAASDTLSPRGLHFTVADAVAMHHETTP
jgi:hypothetical protein